MLLCLALLSFPTFHEPLLTLQKLHISLSIDLHSGKLAFECLGAPSWLQAYDGMIEWLRFRHSMHLCTRKAQQQLSHKRDTTAMNTRCRISGVSFSRGSIRFDACHAQMALVAMHRDCSAYTKCATDGAHACGHYERVANSRAMGCVRITIVLFGKL